MVLRSAAAGEIGQLQTNMRARMIAAGVMTPEQAIEAARNQNAVATGWEVFFNNMMARRPGSMPRDDDDNKEKKNKEK